MGIRKREGQGCVSDSGTINIVWVSWANEFLVLLSDFADTITNQLLCGKGSTSNLQIVPRTIRTVTGREENAVL